MIRIVIGIMVVVFILIPQTNAEATKQLQTNDNQKQAIEKFEVEDSNTFNAYKMLYENSVEANDRLITIINWSLGLVTTFLLALFGGQIFFNFKLKKEELDNIKGDIEERILKIRVEIFDEIRETNEEHSQSVIESIDKMEKNIKESVKERLEEMVDLSETKYKLVGKDIEITKSELEKNIDKLNLDINTKLNYLEIALQKAEGYIWDLRGVESNALNQFIVTSIMQIDTNDQRYVYTLYDIVDYLKKIKKIDIRCYEGLLKLLDILPKEQENEKEFISKFIDEVPVYELVGDRVSGYEYKYIRNKPS